MLIQKFFSRWSGTALFLAVYNLQFQIFFEFLRTARFGKNRVGDGFIEFDGFVIDARGLDAAGKMVDDERRLDSLNINKLRVTVFFFLFLPVGVCAFVNRFGGYTFRRKFELDQQAVLKSQFYDI